VTRLDRFLANPPRRISARAVIARKAATGRLGLRKHLPGLIREQKGLCFYCRVPIVFRDPRGKQRAATVDHYDPLAKGGANNRENAVAACRPCNQAKRDMSAEDFMRARARDRDPEGPPTQKPTPSPWPRSPPR
jgi:5-methylcytosine-specific restriction endonuclease McrA